VDENRWAPLHYAVLGGHVDLVRYLLSRKVNLNAHTPNRLFALHFAAEVADPMIITLLVEHGAAVSPKDSRGQTPLHHAVSSQNIAITKVLLNLSADPNIVDHEGFAPLHLATELGSQELVNVLLQGGAIPELTMPGIATRTRVCSPIHIAAHRAYIDILERLLDAAPKDILSRSSQKERKPTPLHLAASQGHSDVIQYLIERQADIGALDQNNETPLFLAVRARRAASVRQLANSATKLKRNIQKQIPLHVAARRGFFGIAEFLLETDCDEQLMARDHEGNTPLHLALIAKRRETVTVLLDKGADIMARNDARESSYTLASGGIHLLMNKFIAEHPDRWHSQPVWPTKRIPPSGTGKTGKKTAFSKTSRTVQEEDEIDGLESAIRGDISEVRDAITARFEEVMQLIRDLEEDAQ
jgi:ankyrin repeat protein